MARRKQKQSALDDLIEITAKLPWWLGILLAIAAYLALRHDATREIAIATVPGQIGDMVTAQLWKTFAMIGQYVLPSAFLIGALVLALKRRKHIHLVEQISCQQSALLKMSWQEFEMLVGEAFRLQGLKVGETRGGDTE